MFRSLVFVFIKLLKVAYETACPPLRLKLCFDAVGRLSVFIIHHDYQEGHRCVSPFCFVKNSVCAQKLPKQMKKRSRAGQLPSAEPPNCFSLSSYVRNYTTLSSGIIFGDEKLICPSCASRGGRSASGWAGSAVCGGRATNWHNVARLAKKKTKTKNVV